MSSFFSKPFRNILGSDLSQDVTAGTSDKWIKPEDKDALENMAVMMALAALPGDLGEFFSSDLGKTAMGLLTGGNTGAFSGLFDALGLNPGQKDFIEHLATLAALTAAGNYLAKDELEKASTAEALEYNLVTGLSQAAAQYNDPK